MPTAPKDFILKSINQAGHDAGMQSTAHLFDIDLYLDKYPAASQFFSHIILNSDFANEDDYPKRYQDAINDIQWSLDQQKNQSNYLALKAVAHQKMQRLRQAQQNLAHQIGSQSDNLLINFDAGFEQPRIITYQALFYYVNNY